MTAFLRLVILTCHILSNHLLLKHFALQDDGSYECPVPNEEEQGNCDMPECQFTAWGEWSVCSGELCGGPGTNTRTRDCIPAVSDFEHGLYSVNRHYSKTLNCRMTTALDALFQTRKSRVPATCRSASLQNGENGAYVLVSFVEALAPIPGPVTAFQR